MIEWVAFACTLLGLWRLGSSHPDGYLMGCAGNILWIFAFYTEPSIIAMNLCLWVVNVRGYIRWRRKNDRLQEIAQDYLRRNP